MKSQSHALTTSFIGVVSLFAANTLTAIEPAPDNAKPPAELEERIEKPNEAEVKMPFIGVVTAALPEMVADHLNLKCWHCRISEYAPISRCWHLRHSG